MFQEQQERASTIISIFQVSACDPLAIVPLTKPRVSGKRGIPKGMAIGRYEHIWDPCCNNLLQMYAKKLRVVVWVVGLQFMVSSLLLL